MRFGLSTKEKSYYEKCGKLNVKWGPGNKLKIISGWEWWDINCWDVRDNLLDWLLERDDNQLVEDISEMIDNLENVLENMNMNENAKNEVMMGATELFISVVEDSDYDLENCELQQQQHSCDNISLEISEDGELCPIYDAESMEEPGNLEQEGPLVGGGVHGVVPGEGDRFNEQTDPDPGAGGGDHDEAPGGDCFNKQTDPVAGGDDQDKAPGGENCFNKQTGSESNNINEDLTNIDKIKHLRRMNQMRRKRFEQRPVTEELQITSRRRADTWKGQRMLDAMGVDKHLIQDKSRRMEVCGADVEALYPSLSDIQVAEIVYQAIMETDVGFEGVDYMEGCKYIAMNSTAQECRTLPLRRILPRRRHHNGTRPGVTGVDPRGPEAGNQDQWKFPPGVKLTEKEKRMIVATVMKIAVMVLFRTHVYEFGGKFFLQKKGGPIGLRSTCAIARIVMLWWDERFLALVAANNLTLEEQARYMDDIRVWLYSIRLGWRWTRDGLRFCRDWRKEEMAGGMTGLQKTMEILKGMMNDICDWLILTMESVDDFGGMLPTLDLNIWVRKDNIVLYIFYQKPMASNMVIQKRSAMPENMRVATLNQEVIRRMLNTSERLDVGHRVKVIDEYAQKLSNSGYDMEYIRKVMIGGLKGYERKLALSHDISYPKWKPLHQGANYNASGRRKKKTLVKPIGLRKGKTKSRRTTMEGVENGVASKPMPQDGRT